ncbi:hypothetical protein GG681_15855 [Epibacterium sp. SM1969]|uniref:TIGR03016 family PEP-CTERM system-associated outer membrane protein n=1 Tax=Tritonibacter aquimaris TaxID=2663379 RepID=A0A844ANF1_9RHOB|nr:hypothetical protein [Tritonibacter aquimaris]MQY44120.1 hypothetical protein [Tritonibacter aquimaris]
MPRVVSLSVLASFAVPLVWAQENTAEENFGISLSQSLRVTDNIRLNEESQGTTTAAETELSFGYRFGSGLQSLTLRGDAVARLQDDPVLGSDAGLNDLNFDLEYLRQSANARLQLQAQYLRTDLLFNDPLEQDDLTEEDLGDNTGRRNTITTGLEFETGLQSTVGLRLAVQQQDERYSDVIDPDLFDTDTRSATLTVPVRFSEHTEARLIYFNSRYDAEDLVRTERDSERLTIGLSHALSPISRLSFDVGHSEVVETFDSRPGFEDRETGAVYNIVWDRDLANGALQASYSSNITQEGRRSTFQIERVLSLPDGSLTVSLGASDGRNSSPRPIGAINWRKQNGRSNFSADLSRNSIVSTTTSEVTETTRLNLLYGLELTTLSSLNFGLRYANISELNGPVDEEDRRRASFDVSLNRQVTEDWDLVTGYQFSHARRDTGSSGNSNALFFTLKRDFGGLN